MAYYDDFVSRVSQQGSTPTDYFKNLAADNVNQKFKDSPNYKSILIDGAPTDVRIVQTEKYNERTILFRPDTVKNIGDIATVDGLEWIITEYFVNEIYPKATIALCASEQLKWIDSKGFELNHPFAMDSMSKVMGISNTQQMTLPESHRRIIVSNEPETVNIERNKRFILDGRPWIVTDIDSLSVTGLIYLTLKEDQFTDADNKTLGIADYHGYTANYTVTILNGEHFSIRAGTSLQLHSEVRNNGKVVGNTVSYSSSDASVATVTPTGLVTAIANGNVTITATLVDDPTITDTTTITAELENTNNYSISIAESPDVISGQTKLFNAVIRNNNSVLTGRSVQWYLYGDDGVSPPISASLVFDSTTQCKIQGKTVGRCKLKIVLVGDSSVYSIIPITIKSLI